MKAVSGLQRTKEILHSSGCDFFECFGCPARRRDPFVYKHRPDPLVEVTLPSTPRAHTALADCVFVFERLGEGDVSACVVPQKLERNFQRGRTCFVEELQSLGRPRRVRGFSRRCLGCDRAYNRLHAAVVRAEATRNGGHVGRQNGGLLGSTCRSFLGAEEVEGGAHFRVGVLCWLHARKRVNEVSDLRRVNSVGGETAEAEV
mmetsp:Transcript_58681/g.117862  ORF Transcript_58681/g.117862 Transcript_58681/m.117862 type:complete len:203 (-) Transcript_58681:806-1414(-)